MADILSPEQRSRNMSAIRQKHEAEIYFRKLLFARDTVTAYRKKASGTSRYLLHKYNTAIFVHGCFWHRHQGCKYAYMPKSRQEFWQRKFDDNVRRDKIVKDELQKRNIKCLIVWECTIRQMMKKQETENCVIKKCIDFMFSDEKILEI